MNPRNLHGFNCLILLILACSCSKEPTASPDAKPDFPMTFKGPSSALKATVVVPTLDTPVTNGNNVIWCSSFQLAWKELQKLAGEPVKLHGSPDAAKLLNGAPDPGPDLPEGSYMALAGYTEEGIVGQIEKEFRQKFPGKPLPDLTEMEKASLVAYAHLEANAKFTLPYRQNRKPFTFTCGDGQKVDVNSFGLSADDRHNYEETRSQARILFETMDDRDQMQELVIDLCTNSAPSQVVVALISPEPTLAADLAKINNELTNRNPRITDDRTVHIGETEVGDSDVLLVPEFYWSITHSFKQLMGRVSENARLDRYPLDTARQDIDFHLDKSGAELVSTATMETHALSREYEFDRPFLIYMKKRGAAMPYFVMWVDNAELMHPW